MISLSTSFAGIGDSGFVRKVADGFMAVFLLVNLVIRFSSIFYYTPYNGYIAVFLGCVVLACAWVVVFQRFLMVYLFIFGFSFFLFGFGSFEIQSRVFEILVTCVASTLFFVNLRAGRDRRQRAEVGGRSESSKLKGERGEVEGQRSEVKGVRGKIEAQRSRVKGERGRAEGVEDGCRHGKDYLFGHWRVGVDCGGVYRGGASLFEQRGGIGQRG